MSFSLVPIQLALPNICSLNNRHMWQWNTSLWPFFFFFFLIEVNPALSWINSQWGLGTDSCFSSFAWEYCPQKSTYTDQHPWCMQVVLIFRPLCTFWGSIALVSASSPPPLKKKKKVWHLEMFYWLFCHGIRKTLKLPSSFGELGRKNICKGDIWQENQY